MKRNIVSAYVQHEAWHPLPLYAAVCILDDPFSLPTSCVCTQLMVPLSNKNHIKTFRYHIHWNITSAQLAIHGPCMASHAWLIQDSWILLFNVFFNLILKLCLYCREIIPFLLLFCFWSRFVTFLLLIRCNFMKNYFFPK